MSNTVEFRWAVKKKADGTVIDQRLQYRTRGTLISLLGVNLSVWSDWEDVGTSVVEVIV